MKVGRGDSVTNNCSSSLAIFATPVRGFACCQNITAPFDSPHTQRNLRAPPAQKRFAYFIVPGGRIELPWIAPHDFESCASTNSAIPAYYLIVSKNALPLPLFKNISRFLALL